MPEHNVPLDSFLNRPPQVVLNLAPREREIALLIYQHGGATAKEIEAHLSKPIANATVRTVLLRLKRKGIVTSRMLGAYKTLTYHPALSNEYVRESVLLNIAKEHFSGSLSSLSQTLSRMIQTGPVRESRGPRAS